MERSFGFAVCPGAFSLLCGPATSVLDLGLSASSSNAKFLLWEMLPVQGKVVDTNLPNIGMAWLASKRTNPAALPLASLAIASQRGDGEIQRAGNRDSVSGSPLPPPAQVTTRRGERARPRNTYPACQKTQRWCGRRTASLQTSHAPTLASPSPTDRRGAVVVGSAACTVTNVWPEEGLGEIGSEPPFAFVELWGQRAG